MDVQSTFAGYFDQNCHFDAENSLPTGNRIVMKMIVKKEMLKVKSSSDLSKEGRTMSMIRLMH
jgi:uncharacterized Zn ribbon protein